jgi:hypothetical protein
MPHSPAPWRQRTPLYVVGIVVSVLAAPLLQAQNPDGDAMAFPRGALTAYLAADAEKVWQHAGPTLREMWESPNGVRMAAEELTSGIGRETGVLDEQLFAHPEDAGWKVYVRTARHAQVPELFWIVIFSPANRQIGMIMPQPRQTIRTLFPEVRLPPGAE